MRILLDMKQNLAMILCERVPVLEDVLKVFYGDLLRMSS